MKQVGIWWFPLGTAAKVSTRARNSNKHWEKHFGLFSVRERLEYIGGGFKIQSAPGAGTTATLTVPLNFRIGKELGPLKVAKYFQWEMRPEGLVVERDENRIQVDAIVDGVYVLRTSVAADRINTDETVLAYKRLAGVERAFRSTKSVDLHVRPIHHRSADRRPCAHLSLHARLLRRVAYAPQARSRLVLMMNILASVKARL